jgi:hypothetical protein
MSVVRWLVVAGAVILVLEAVGVPALSMLESAGYDLLEWLIKQLLKQLAPW